MVASVALLRPKLLGNATLLVRHGVSAFADVLANVEDLALVANAELALHGDPLQEGFATRNRPHKCQQRVFYLNRAERSTGLQVWTRNGGTPEATRVRSYTRVLMP